MKIFLKLKKCAALILALFLTIPLVSCGDNDEDDGSGYSFRYTLYGNPKNLDPQLAEDRSSLMIIQNMFMGLVMFGQNGKLEYGVAKSCEVSEDGLRYSFILRDDCYWRSEAGPEGVVTAHDFVYAFKRIFDPVMQSPYREKFSFLQNARAIIDGNMDYSELGVYAVNNTELVFYLDRPNSEFLYLLTTAPAMPCNKRFFEGTKARYGLDEESIISNGAFYMTQWSYDPYGSDNLIYMKRNYENSTADRVYPYMLTFYIDRDSGAPAENYDASVTDLYVSRAAQKKSFVTATDVKSYETSSLGIIFNPDVQINGDIKKALSLTVDRKAIEKICPDDLKVAYGIVPGSMYVADSVYREQYPAISFDFYKNEITDETKEMAKEFFDTYPGEAEILVRNTSDAGVVSKIIGDWQDKLGVYIELKYADDDEYYTRMENDDYFMAFAEIDTSDKSVYYYLKNVVDTLYGPDERTDLKNGLDEALTYSSFSDRCDVFSRTENEIMLSGDYIPLFYRKLFLTYRKNAKDLNFNPFSEQINFRKAKYYK